MNTIRDYLQTQALALNPDSIAIARAATQAVLAHGHAVHLVEQDVGSHQNRVGEQAHGGVLGALLLGLVLELGHT